MELLQSISRNRLALTGLIILVPMFFCAILAPFVAPHNPLETNLKSVLAAPSFSHPFGTDVLGRDVLARVIYGSRVSLLVGELSGRAGTDPGNRLRRWFPHGGPRGDGA